MKRRESDDPKAWFGKGEEDRLSATLLMQSNQRVTDMVCYRAQQCAEKDMKGYLKSRKVQFKWVHDLEYLVNLCGTCDAEFNQLKPLAEGLTRSAELSRYPSDDDAATVEETRAASDAPERIRELVLRKFGG